MKRSVAGSSYRTLAIALSLVLCLPLGGPALAQQAETTMALPALTLTFSPTYLADAMGFWSKAGLKVKLIDITGIGAMNAVLSGSVDFSNSSGPSIIRANIRGQKLVGIGSTLDGLVLEIVLHKSVAEAAGVTADSPIEKRAQALRGKKVSLTSLNTIPHGYLRYFARKGGVDPEREMTIASQRAEAGLAALKSGAVDAYIQSTPWTLIAVQQGIGVLLSSALRGDFPELLPFAYNIVVSRPGFCDQKPTVCSRLMDGYLQAMIYMHEHPKESIEILRKRVPGADPKIVEEAIELTRRWTPKSTKVSEAGLTHAQELMVVAGMIKPEEKLSSLEAIYTNRYAR